MISRSTPVSWRSLRVCWTEQINYRSSTSECSLQRTQELDVHYHWKEALRSIIAYTFQFSKVFTLHSALTRVIPEKKSESVSHLSFLCVIFNLLTTSKSLGHTIALHNEERLVILLARCYVIRPFSVSRSKFVFCFLLVATGPITRTVSRLRLSFVLRTCVGPLVAAVAAILMKRLVQLMRYSRDE